MSDAQPSAQPYENKWLVKMLAERIDWANNFEILDGIVHDVVEDCASNAEDPVLVSEYIGAGIDAAWMDAASPEDRLDAWSHAGSAINNSGPEAQISFLAEALGPHSLIATLRTELMAGIPSELRVSAIDFVDYVARSDYAPVVPVVHAGESDIRVEQLVVGLSPMDRRMLMSAYKSSDSGGSLPLTGVAIPMQQLDLQALEAQHGEPVQLSHVMQAPMSPLLSEHDPESVKSMPAVRASASDRCRLHARIDGDDLRFGFSVGQTQFETAPEPIHRVLERQFAATKRSAPRLHA